MITLSKLETKLDIPDEISSDENMEEEEKEDKIVIVEDITMHNEIDESTFRRANSNDKFISPRKFENSSSGGGERKNSSSDESK